MSKQKGQTITARDLMLRVEPLEKRVKDLEKGPAGDPGMSLTDQVLENRDRLKQFSGLLESIGPRFSQLDNLFERLDKRIRTLENAKEMPEVRDHGDAETVSYEHARAMLLHFVYHFPHPVNRLDGPGYGFECKEEVGDSVTITLKKRVAK